MAGIKLELSEIKNLVIEPLKKPKNVLILLLGAGSSFIAYELLKIYLNRRRFAHIPGPPIKGFTGFFRGNFNDLIEANKNNRTLVELFDDWQKQYGDTFKFETFGTISIVTTDRDTIKEVLIEKNLPKSEGQQRRMAFPLGERFLGIGLLTDHDNVRWKHRRAIFNPGFHRQILMTFIDHFNQITTVLTEKFRNMADGKTVVSLFSEINKATLDAIALIAFGMNTDAVTQSESLLNSYLSKILYTAMKSGFDPFMEYRPLKHHEVSEFRKMTKYLRTIGKEKILERIRAIQNNEYVPNDILTTILKEFKGEELDVEAMIDDFLTFFVAGQETTANALSFCFLEMCKNPEITKHAREEVDRVLGEREEVTYQDFTDLKYCSAIFKEALRLFPPAPVVSRQIIEPMTIQGYKIPGNTQLFMSTFVSSRDERYFKEPLVFKPERFFKDSGADDSFENYVYYPFSLGSRNCIGQNFAQLEGVTVIAKMVQKFDMRLDPTQSFSLDQAITLRPRDGTRVYLSLRE